MSDNKIHEDEDYLDSLLKSVLSGNTSSSYEEDLDIDEDEFAKSIEMDFEDGLSEDDFLSEFENDILLSDEIPSPSDSKDNEYTNASDDLFADNKDILSSAAGDIASISDDMKQEEADKPKKKGLFGKKKKKIVIADSEEKVEDEVDEIIDPYEDFDFGNIFSDDMTINESEAVEQQPIDDNIDMSYNDFAQESNNEENSYDNAFDSVSSDDSAYAEAFESTKEEEQAPSVEESFSNINNIDDDLINSFESLFGNNSSMEGSADNTSEDFGITNSNVRPEDDISNLMDILGAFGDTEGLSEEEIDVENKDGKWKKKKKKKEKKKKDKKKKDKKKKKDGDNDEKSLDDTLAELDAASAFGDAFGDPFANQGDSSEGNKADDDFGFGFAFEDMGFSNTEENSSNSIDSKDFMKRMDRGSLDDDDEDEEDGKKSKKKKEKKPKKKKEKKPKKKKVKEKKEKVKDYELEQVIQLPKGFFVIAMSLVVLMIIFLIFGGSLYYYNGKMQSATSLYVDKKYSEAYNELSGLEISEDDMAFYNQILTVMYVLRHYEAANSYIELNRLEDGLHSLVNGVKSYDKYQNLAREYKCFDDMTVVLGWINTTLNEVYGMTESEARQLYLIDDKYEYAYLIRTIAAEVSKRLEEEKNDSDN